MPPPRRYQSAHRARSRIRFGPLVIVLALLAGGVVFWRATASSDKGSDGAIPSDPAATSTESPGGSPTKGNGSPSPTTTPTPTEETPGPINTKFPGLTTFRGNATRTYYGEGPMPDDPYVMWSYPETGGLCGVSTDVDTKTWCGTGWTGQPNVIEHEDGTIEVRIGAYDYDYHFFDGETGEVIRPNLDTGDLAKGSASSDPDGYPLYYGGSRDNLLRVVALDRRKPTVLWSIHSEESVPNPVWNDDWDGAPLIIGDYMLEGSEASWFYVIKLNRSYDDNGKVQVDPEVIDVEPAWDDQLLADLGGSDDVSVESSIAFHDGVAYFRTSGGLVQGWDVSKILSGESDEMERVFRFWNGDDSDATIVIDEEGYLYSARHGEHGTARDREVGDLIKLDPTKPNDPVVWDVFVPGTSADGGGIWSTPAIYGPVVYVTTNSGDLLVINKKTGKVLHTLEFAPPTWMSPVPIDGELLIGDCAGGLHKYDISKPLKRPKHVWTENFEGCIESTPAVWKDMIWFGTRAGTFYGIGDRDKG